MTPAPSDEELAAIVMALQRYASERVAPDEALPSSRWQTVARLESCANELPAAWKN